MPVIEKNGRWTFRVNTPTRNGAECKMLPFLWDSEENATKDIPLYLWYKRDSRKREDNEPALSSVSKKKWFIDIKPDKEWDPIREYLSSTLNMATITKPKRKYNKVTALDYTYESTKRRNKRATKHRSEKGHQDTANVMEIKNPSANVKSNAVYYMNPTYTTLSGHIGIGDTAAVSPIPMCVDSVV